MSEVFSILLHNRQRYEQGKEGLWFSLPTTTEKLQEALREIGISADNPQDFFLYDYRSPQERPIKLPRDLVLSADVDELNFLAARLEKLDAAELSELNAALTSPQSDFHSIGQIIDYPDNVDYYVHLPDVTGTGQLGDYYLNRSGMVDMPEEWKAGIFLPRFGLHIANTEHGVFTDYGYLVKSGDEWQRVHEGQPVPEKYRVMAYPAPEILRDEAPARTVQPEVAPTAEAAAPPPVVPITLNSQNSADRMKEITDRLETGIQELFESERYKAYLTSMAKFHSYSFNNTLLIAMQGGQLELDKLCTVDRYPSDSFVFSSHGYDLHIDNELVADAFANLPQQEQSILILYCVLDMADGEIASLTGMSRSAVQRHRTKTLKELRVKLMALMPEGG